MGIEEYASEVDRVTEFLSTVGESLLNSVAAARDRSSDEMDFEEAARQHERHERIQQVLKLRDELASDIDHLGGVAITPSSEEEAIELWFLVRGVWLAPRRFPLRVVEGKPVSLDRRLRELIAVLERPQGHDHGAPGAPRHTRPLVLLKLERRRVPTVRPNRRRALPQTSQRHPPSNPRPNLKSVTDSTQVPFLKTALTTTPSYLPDAVLAPSVSAGRSAFGRPRDRGLKASGLYQRSTDAYQRRIFLQHRDGINRTRLGRGEGIGAATVERYFQRQLERQSGEKQAARCPQGARP